MVQIKDFKDLEFKTHKSIVNLPEEELNMMPDMIGSTQAEITFDNGVHLSVIFGEIFYSNGIDTYEAWASEVDDCPRGDLTEDEVSEYMKELQLIKVS